MKVLVGRKRKEKKKEGEKNEENIKSQRAKSQDRKTPENQTCELQASRRGRGGGGAERRNLSLLWRKEELPAALPVHPKIP
jgi:hypothetical protein